MGGSFDGGDERGVTMESGPRELGAGWIRVEAGMRRVEVSRGSLPRSEEMKAAVESSSSWILTATRETTGRSDELTMLRTTMHGE